MSDAMRLKTKFGEQRWLFVLLCGLIFLTALTTGDNVFDNAWLIFGYEALFVVAFLASRGKAFYSGALFPVRSVGFWLLAAWFISITLSLINSPYGLMMEWFAVQRYFQSLFHIIFFLCVRSFFSSYRGNKDALFGWLGASVTALAIAFIMAWQLLPEPLDYMSKEWFLHPPLNAHIRITGFLVASATVALIPFFKDRFRSIINASVFYVLGLSVWGLMFWGRRTWFDCLFDRCVSVYCWPVEN